MVRIVNPLPKRLYSDPGDRPASRSVRGLDETSHWPAMTDRQRTDVMMPLSCCLAAIDDGQFRDIQD